MSLFISKSIGMSKADVPECFNVAYLNTFHVTSYIIVFCRLTITASCPMDLQYFPMDRQLCNIEIESCKLS